MPLLSVSAESSSWLLGWVMAKLINIQTQGNSLVALFDDGSKQFAHPTPTGIWLVSAGGSAPPVPGGDAYVWPFPFSATGGDPESEFGMRWGRLHAGMDFGWSPAVNGAAVKAAGAGKVVTAGVHSGYGNTVILQHAKNRHTLYAHMQDGSITVSLGQTVPKNHVLGKVGNTGNSFGAHLHFETHENGYNWNLTAINPRVAIPKWNANP